MKGIQFDKRSIPAYLFLLAILAVVAATSIALYSAVHDSDTFFLVREGDGTWIRSYHTVDLEIKRTIETETEIFRREFEVRTVPREAHLHFRAYRASRVLIDDVCVYENKESRKDWNTSRAIDLASHLKPGRHTLSFEVSNIAGPPALTASCKPLGIRTDTEWEVSSDGITWSRAFPADQVVPPDIYHAFKTTDKAFASILPFLLPAFLVIFFSLFFCGPEYFPERSRRPLPLAELARWCALGLYLVLAVNNFFKLPLYMGMDHRGHLEYVHFIAENWRIPLVTDGWSMAEPPLFYAISSMIYSLLGSILSMDSVYRILRIIPLLCGALQIEICYRALKTVYPDREDLQAFGTIIGGLLPVNIFVSQFIGTEPLAGCLLSLALLYAFRLINSDTDPGPGFFLTTGVILGLSVLSKVTALILIPALVLIIFINSFKRYSLTGKCLMQAARNSAIVLGAVFILSGWYFIRNYHEFGRFIITNTSYWGNSVGAFPYWQDPSYRTTDQLFLSLRAFIQPVYSGLFSFWDALYSSFWADGWLSGKSVYLQRPPWNYDFMLSGVLLSLIPFTAIILGMVNVFRQPSEKMRSSVLFSTLCLFSLLAALIYQFLVAPMYPAVKGKYLLGLMPCLAVLGASGFDLVSPGRRRLIWSLASSLLLCWGICVYLGYFVKTVPDELRIIDQYKLAADLTDHGRLAEAADELLEIRRINPSALRVRPDFLKSMNDAMHAFAGRGQDAAALNLLLKLRELQPDNPSHYYNIACIYSKQNMRDQSVLWLKKAVDKGFHDRDLVGKDPDLANIRDTAYVIELLKGR